MTNREINQKIEDFYYEHGGGEVYEFSHDANTMGIDVRWLIIWNCFIMSIDAIDHSKFFHLSPEEMYSALPESRKNTTCFIIASLLNLLDKESVIQSIESNYKPIYKDKPNFLKPYDFNIIFSQNDIDLVINYKVKFYDVKLKRDWNLEIEEMSLNGSHGMDDYTYRHIFYYDDLLPLKPVDDLSVHGIEDWLPTFYEWVGKNFNKHYHEHHTD